MSSIDSSSSSSSSSDRSSQTDEARRVRESYQQREADNAKKQGQQIRRLTEAHAAEVELKDEHSREIEDMKAKTRDIIGRRDMQYQREIDDLRDMHQKQVQRLASDAQDRMTRTEGGLKNEVNRVNKTNESQQKLMQTNYEDQLKGRDASLEEFTNRSRRVQQEEGQRRTGEFNRITDEKIGTLVKDRDERLEEKQNLADETRHSKDLEIKRLSHQRDSDIERLTSEGKLGIERERENNRVTQEDQRESMSHDLKEIRDRYSAGGEKQRAAMEKARDELTDTVSRRVDNEVDALRTKSSTLGDDNIRQRVKMEHQKQIELSDLRNSMQANIDQLEEAKRDTVDLAAKRTHTDVDRVNKTNSQVLHGQNQFYQDKIAMDSLRSDERIDNANLEHGKILAQEKTSSESRYERLRGSNEVEQAKMRNYFERASQTMKENFETTLRDMRDRTKRDQDGLFAQFAKQAQDNDAKFQQKLTDLNVRFEHEVADLQDGRVKDVKDEKTTSERQKTEISKKADLDLRAQAAQYQYRIGKLEDEHKREIEQINRNHEESLANLTKTRQT